MPMLVSEKDFEQEIKDGLVVVDLFAKWCGPCKMVSPIIDELSVELEDKAKFIKVDVDESPDVARKYSISSIPTILVLKDGEVKDTIVGFSPKANIKEKLSKFI